MSLWISNYCDAVMFRRNVRCFDATKIASLGLHFSMNILTGVANAGKTSMFLFDTDTFNEEKVFSVLFNI